MTVTVTAGTDGYSRAVTGDDIALSISVVEYSVIELVERDMRTPTLQVRPTADTQHRSHRFNFSAPRRCKR